MERLNPAKHLIEALGGKCSVCEKKELLQIHHKIPLKDGGKDGIENLKILCLACHRKEHTKRKKQSNDKGFILRVRVKKDYYFKLIEKYPEVEINCSRAISKALKKTFPLEVNEND